MTDVPEEPVATALAEGAKKRWFGLGETGGIFGRLAEGGKFTEKLSDGFRGMNFVNGPNRVAAFGKCATTGVGVAMMADAAFRGKKGDNEDRGAVGRVIEFIVGGGVAAGGILAGKGRL